MNGASSQLPTTDDLVENAIRVAGAQLEALGLLSEGQRVEAANSIINNLMAERANASLSLAEQRQILRRLLATERHIAGASDPSRDAAISDLLPESVVRERSESLKDRISKTLLQRIDMGLASTLSKDELREQIATTVRETLVEFKLRLGTQEQREIIAAVVADMVGLGPLEPLLADESVNDILVNGAHQIFVERAGRLTLTDASFRDNAHVVQVARRIVSNVGRRVDELNPIVDARLDDGSRVNIILPPLALDGPAIAIRKFSRHALSLDAMVQAGSLSRAMSDFLKISARCRANIIISGGTGSGKTTLLNALSSMIDETERIITIEDAAELRLQQRHVVRLETRLASLEGVGEITIRHLLKNALRMRPDRIILGEVRGEEALDMLQAMNTGHDGSMCTLHANSPEEAVVRLENMVALGGTSIPSAALRQQIGGAVHLIVQVSRMQDGKRRISQISEVRGFNDGEVVVVPIFVFTVRDTEQSGAIRGDFERKNSPETFFQRAASFGLVPALKTLFK